MRFFVEASQGEVRPGRVYRAGCAGPHGCGRRQAPLLLLASRGKDLPLALAPSAPVWLQNDARCPILSWWRTSEVGAHQARWWLLHALFINAKALPSASATVKAINNGAFIATSLAPSTPMIQIIWSFK
jgi:hypothetical protein